MTHLGKCFHLGGSFGTTDDFVAAAASQNPLMPGFDKSVFRRETRSLLRPLSLYFTFLSLFVFLLSFEKRQKTFLCPSTLGNPGRKDRNAGCLVVYVVLDINNAGSSTNWPCKPSWQTMLALLTCFFYLVE